MTDRIATPEELRQSDRESSQDLARWLVGLPRIDRESQPGAQPTSRSAQKEHEREAGG